METLRADGATIHFLAVVRGPLADGERVREAVEERRPKAIALSIGVEQLKALQAWDGTLGEAESEEEAVYMEGMRRFTEIRKPPPCFVAALEAASAVKSRCIAVDLDDRAYSRAFTEQVSTWDLMRQNSFVQNKLASQKYTAETSQSFALELDAILTKRKGYKALEEARATHMAEGIAAAGRKYGTVLAVIEIERAASALEGLRRRARRS